MTDSSSGPNEISGMTISEPPTCRTTNHLSTARSGPTVRRQRVTSTPVASNEPAMMSIADTAPVSNPMDSGLRAAAKSVPATIASGSVSAPAITPAVAAATATRPIRSRRAAPEAPARQGDHHPDEHRQFDSQGPRRQEWRVLGERNRRATDEPVNTPRVTARGHGVTECGGRRQPRPGEIAAWQHRPRGEGEHDGAGDLDGDEPTGRFGHRNVDVEMSVGDRQDHRDDRQRQRQQRDPQRP